MFAKSLKRWKAEGVPAMALHAVAQVITVAAGVSPIKLQIKPSDVARLMSLLTYIAGVAEELQGAVTMGTADAAAEAATEAEIASDRGSTAIVPTAEPEPDPLAQPAAPLEVNVSLTRALSVQVILDTPKSGIGDPATATVTVERLKLKLSPKGDIDADVAVSV